MTRYYQVPTTFSEWRYFARYSLDDCAQVFKVSKRTVRNWESGKIEPPRAVLICLQLFSGRLDFLGKNWTGFCITRDCIESPEGDFVYAWEVRALRYAMHALDMRHELRMNPEQKPDNVTYIHEAKNQKNKNNNLPRKAFPMVKKH